MSYLPPPLPINPKDPWEAAIRNDNEKKRKGKHHEVSSKEETRNSLWVKLNQLAGAKEVSAGGGESKSSAKSAKATTSIHFLID